MSHWKQSINQKLAMSKFLMTGKSVVQFLPGSFLIGIKLGTE